MAPKVSGFIHSFLGTNFVAEPIKLKIGRNHPEDGYDHIKKIHRSGNFSLNRIQLFVISVDEIEQILLDPALWKVRGNSEASAYDTGGA